MNCCRVMQYFLGFLNARLLLVIAGRQVALRGEGFLRIPDIDFNKAYSPGTRKLSLEW